jgi:arylsulfatase A-like enzyme
MISIKPLSFLCIVFLVTLFSTAAPEDTRPNILFIFTDDQRWDTLGCYGNDVIRTPNLDKLAAQGARLDSFFVSGPVCCASRAVFLSGFHPHQSGIIDSHGSQDLAEGTKTVATMLNQAGYVTGFVGTAHLGGDPHAWILESVRCFSQKPIQNIKIPSLF